LNNLVNSFTRLRISSAAILVGESSRTVLPRAALSANATRWHTLADNTGNS
jgi:hypothetical protein